MPTNYNSQKSITKKKHKLEYTQMYLRVKFSMHSPLMPSQVVSICKTFMTKITTVGLNSVTPCTDLFMSF